MWQVAAALALLPTTITKPAWPKPAGAPWRRASTRSRSAICSCATSGLYRERQLAGLGTDSAVSAMGAAHRGAGAGHDRGRLARAPELRRHQGCSTPALRAANSTQRCWRILPVTADPCGENGEFHTFVYDGPMFRHAHRAGSGRDSRRRRVRLRGPGGGAVPRIVSLIASATEIVDALGQLDSWWAVRTSAIIRKRCCACPPARGRGFRWTAQPRNRPAGEGSGAHVHLHLRSLR